MADVSKVDKVKQWSDYVTKNGENAAFVPQALLDEAKALNERHKKFDKWLKEEVSKQEIQLTFDTQAIYMKIREHLAKNGQPGVWGRTMEFNYDALNDGQFVVMITDKV